MNPDNICSKCYSEASEDYMIDGEYVCEECYFECLDNNSWNDHIIVEKESE